MQVATGPCATFLSLSFVVVSHINCQGPLPDFVFEKALIILVFHIIKPMMCTEDPAERAGKTEQTELSGGVCLGTQLECEVRAQGVPASHTGGSPWHSLCSSALLVFDG